MPGTSGPHGPGPQGGTSRVVTVTGVPVSRSVLAAHAVVLAAAVAFWAWVDRHLWFYGDEWDFIARRGVFHAPLSIWFPHNEHWSTLPILLWRGIFSVVHLSSYWPYLVPVLVAHVLIVHLVWRRCLRDGANPWLATVLSLLLGLLGSGWSDLAWAFQIGFDGSVLFGLLALDLADRDSGSLRRDAIVSLVALAALMCSTVGDAMLLALAILLLARRPWRQTIRVLALPVVAYAVWWLAVGRDGLATRHDSLTPAVLAKVPGFVVAQLEATLGSHRLLLGGFVALVLGVWLARHVGCMWSRHPAALALVCAALAFWALAGLGRDSGGNLTPARYVYIGAALVLPFVSLALSSWARLRLSKPVLRLALRLSVLVVVLLYTVGNAEQGVRSLKTRTAFVLHEKKQILGSARLLADGQPVLNRLPFPYGPLTPDDLLRLWRQGVIPHVGPLAAGVRRYDATRLDVLLAGAPLVSGRFTIRGTTGVVASADPPGCITLAPRITPAPTNGSERPGSRPAARPAVRPAVRLALRPGERSASVLVRAPGGTLLIAALESTDTTGGLHAGSVAKIGEHFLTPATGTARLDDAAPGSDLVVDLPRAGAVELCGLGRAPRHLSAA